MRHWLEDGFFDFILREKICFSVILNNFSIGRRWDNEREEKFDIILSQQIVVMLDYSKYF